MSGGDPIEESGQALRMGFVQAMQTAHTTQALLARRGGESRSREEHEQRLSASAAKEHRSLVEHQLRVDQQNEARWWDRQLNQARVEEVRARITRGGELHAAEMRRVEGQIERADKDLARRERAGNLETTQKKILHNHQIAGYVNREQRAAELHELDVEYKKLLIDIRRRTAGFTENLSEQSGPQSAAAVASSAAFAAASTGSETPEGSRDYQAFRERFVEDTGTDPHQVLRGAGSSPGWAPPPMRVPQRDVNGLIGDLCVLAHLLPPIPDTPQPPPPPAVRMEAAVEDAGLNTPIDVEVVEIVEETDAPSANLPVLWTGPEAGR
ncbi:hypothetical protein [Nocardia carnea]|uniref:hypothetical protein n=1 Tax=Nocardia carnea TaxID=37328 RepID=UPI002453BF7B|nr:hypothetical protein [Nocardia carnea]